MIQIENLYLSYGEYDRSETQAPQAKNLATTSLQDITFQVPAGNSILLCGASGCGKTSLLRLMNGLIPHFYPGKIAGNITVAGQDPRQGSLAQNGQYSTTVFQNPRSQFYATDTTSEIAFALENSGIEPEEIASRIIRAATRLHTQNLLNRNIFALSGGQKQLVATTGALAQNPKLFLFDEPTSNLSPEAISRLREVLKLLRQDGATMVFAEHRLSYLRGLIDQVLVLDKGKIIRRYSGKEFFELEAKNLQDLGLRSTKEMQIPTPATPLATPNSITTDGATKEGSGQNRGLEIKNLQFSWGKTPVLDLEYLHFPRGQVSLITGPNGVGKSTLSRIICGLNKAQGQLFLDGKKLRPQNALSSSYMVMQDVHRQLFATSVAGEIQLCLTGLTPQQREEKVSELLDFFDLGELKDRHPASLSGGQKQRLVIACALGSRRDIYLLDEPSSGIDARHLQAIGDICKSIAASGAIVIVVTHDRELICQLAATPIDLGQINRLKTQK